MKDKNKKIICYHLDGTSEERNISEIIFRPAVYGLLIKENKILLSKQFDGYDFPGGGMDIYETIDQTLEREFWEETGVKVKKDKIIDCRGAFFIGYFSDKPVNGIGIYALCHQVGGELSVDHLDDTEKKYVEMPEWIDIKDVDKIKFYNSMAGGSAELIKEGLRIFNQNE